LFFETLCIAISDLDWTLSAMHSLMLKLSNILSDCFLLKLYYCWKFVAFCADTSS